MQLNKKTAAILLVIYVLLLLGVTVIGRSTIIKSPQFVLFWSYREWFGGNRRIGRQILANIAVFVPIGILVQNVFFRRSLPAAVIISMMVSLLIECLQLFLHRGLFEFDDVMNNTLGGIAGWLFYRRCRELLPRWVWFAGFAAACVGLVAVGWGTPEETPNLPRIFCFQVDEVRDGEISGFAFLCDRDSEKLTISLKSDSGKVLVCSTEYKIEREDVNQYFHSKRDYTRVGFKAFCDSMDPNEEYQIIADFGGTLRFETGVYVTGERVHFLKDAETFEPEGLEELLADGTLLVYRPDYHCWVYQIRDELYWVVDSEFNFEEDGSTYIQYQLWTTQTENMPAKRLENGHFWDNIGGYFEDYEVQGDFGVYRVMKRELPKEYAVTSIVTGYYKKGEWIWKEYFRPVR